MKIELTEHKVPKKSKWGTVDRSLKQHIVHVLNDDTGKMVQAGYIGDTHFLPLPGFPAEYVDEVAAYATEQLGRPIAGTQPPPTLDEVARMIAETKAADEDDDE